MFSIKRILLTPEWFCYIIALILEIVCIVLVDSVKNAICIRALEISTPIMVFLFFNFLALFPDFLYIILIIFLNKLAREPFAVAYNLSMGILCILSSGCLAAMLSFCGNSAQKSLGNASIIGITSGFVHLLSGFISHWFMPKDESYFWHNELE